MLAPYRAVHKSRPVERLDDYFSGSAQALRQKYEAALEHIESGKGLTGITQHLAGGGDGGPKGLTDDDVAHFREHWLGGSWAEQTDVEGVLRLGYREAIRVALDRKQPLPIETLWVTTGSGEFELFINEGKHQVTVMVFVPSTRRRLARVAPDTGASRRTWAVRMDKEAVGERLNRSRTKPIVKLQVSGPATTSA
jgi:hypothetical protein